MHCVCIERPAKQSSFTPGIQSISQYSPHGIAGFLYLLAREPYALPLACTVCTCTKLAGSNIHFWNPAQSCQAQDALTSNCRSVACLHQRGLVYACIAKLAIDADHMPGPALLVRAGAWSCMAGLASSASLSRDKQALSACDAQCNHPWLGSRTLHAILQGTKFVQESSAMPASRIAY